ncbi:MAG: hypothetical protein HKN51_14195 [Saprospiraceae bacterium]|nr:hypothetical protein [Saprospiraceae bacterium]
MINWIKSLFQIETEATVNPKRTFKALKNLHYIDQPDLNKIYESLLNLNKDTAQPECENLVKGINEIRYASNTNGYFYFFFPLVSHVLYFKPHYESKLLHHLVGPNFANGEKNVQGMIDVIKGAMKYKLDLDSNYLTIEGQSWVKEDLHKMKEQIMREIDFCQNELNE